MLNGMLWKIGFKGKNPNLFQVFFDPSTMDDSDEGYQDAYLAHFTMLLESIGLLIRRVVHRSTEELAYAGSK